MTAGFIIRVVLEVVAVLALAYGFIHEDKVIAFEDRMLNKIRDRKAQKNPTHAAKKSNDGSSRVSVPMSPDVPVNTGKAAGEQTIQNHAAFSSQEREARAKEAAYCRNQAAAMRAQAARQNAERRVAALTSHNTSHVA